MDRPSHLQGEHQPMVAGGTARSREKDVRTLQKTTVHQTKTQGVEQGSLWKYKPGEKEHRGKNEENTGTIYRREMHRGSKKIRDPNDPGMASKMPAGRNPVAPKIQNRVAKGREEEYQFFS
jgi:hypothetical protein